MVNRLNLIVITILYASVSQAFVKGKYLPKTELPSNVCKVVAVNMKTKTTPVDRYGKPIDKPSISIQEESIYCSSTVVDKNHVMTAAHCYEGAIEKYMPVLSLPVAKTVIDPRTKKRKFLSICTYERGSRKGELRDDWSQYKPCVAGYRSFRQETEIERVEIRCPLKDGKEEVRVASMEQGYPHPMYMSAHEYSKYDIALLKVDRPFVKTTPAKFVDSMPKMINIAKETPYTCRSFGYGLDNEDKHGELKGIETPINVLTEDTIIFKSDYFNKNRTDHGDSGGAIFCRDRTGEDYLVGVVSRGGPISPEFYAEINPYTDRSMYAVIAYNKVWLDMIMKENPLPHGNSQKGKAVFRKLNVKFQMRDLQNEIQKIHFCLKENKSKMNKPLYKKLSQEFKNLKTRYQTRVDEVKAGKDSFYLSGYLAKDYVLKDRIRVACYKASR